MKKLYRWLCKAEEMVCGVGFIFLIAFVFLSAILRQFRFSLSWSIDLAMLLLAWTAFLGADVAWRSGQIIGVDIVTRNLPRRVQRVIEVIIYCIILSTLVVMVVFGVRLAWSERVATYQSMPIPYALVTFSLIVASFSMIFSTLQKLKRSLFALLGKDTSSDTDSPAEKSEASK